MILSFELTIIFFIVLKALLCFLLHHTICIIIT